MADHPRTGPLPLTVRYVADSDRVSAWERQYRMRSPAFGQVPTEHMVLIRWSMSKGWHDATLQPYAPLTLDPAAAGLHYGQAVFEGLKAYSLADGEIGVFRSAEHARRMQNSARRLAMPEIPEVTFTDAVDALVRADQEWVPTDKGSSLYLRPLLIATEATLGVHAATEYLFLVIAFVTGSLSVTTPLTVWLCEDYARAAPGGTGAAKCAGNYAASLLIQERAARVHDCDQVVWLDAATRDRVEEMGAMNIFFVVGPAAAPRLITPPLTDTILPGVTRDSLITLARDLGYAVSEEPVSKTWWRAASEDGTLLEAFAVGTAAVVVPIGGVRSASGGWTIGNGQAGPVARRLRQALVDLHHGTAPDRHGWIHRVPLASELPRVPWRL
jgi:branched-chain amino acid aminotransferase